MTIYTYQKSPSLKYRVARMVVSALQDPLAINKGLDRNQLPGKSYNLKKSAIKHKLDENKKIDQFDVFYVKPKKPSATVIFYLHGGAYINGIYKEHFDFLDKLVEQSHASAVIVDYPLTPSFNYLKTYEVVEKAYEQLLQTTDAENIIFMGDSAGAGLALGFYLKLKIESKPLPRDIVLISPWLDVSLENDEIYKYLKKEPMLKDLTGLQRAGRLYADGDVKNELISPMFGNFSQKPNIHIFIGTNDIFYPDCKKFHDQLKQQNIDVGLYVYREMFHCWLLAQFIKESKHAMKQILKLI